MKSTAELLKEKDRALLVDLYEHEGFQALKRLIEAERINIATKCLNSTPETLTRLQGQAQALKELYQMVHDLYVKEMKKR